MISIGIVKFLSDDAIMWFRWKSLQCDNHSYPSVYVYPKLYTTFEAAVDGNEDYMYNFNTCTHDLEDAMIYFHCFDTSWMVSIKVKACRHPECMMLSNPFV